MCRLKQQALAFHFVVSDKHIQKLTTGGYEN